MPVADAANERLTSLQANTRNATKNHTFTLGYLGNTEMLRQIDGPQSTVWKRAYEPYRAALKTTSIERGATTYASYTLTRDDLARVTTETQSGQLFAGYDTANNLTLTYTYAPRGQLATAETKVNGNTVSLSEWGFWLHHTLFHQYGLPLARNRSHQHHCPQSGRECHLWCLYVAVTLRTRRTPHSDLRIAIVHRCRFCRRGLQSQLAEPGRFCALRRPIQPGDKLGR